MVLKVRECTRWRIEHGLITNRAQHRGYLNKMAKPENIFKNHQKTDSSSNNFSVHYEKAVFKVSENKNIQMILSSEIRSYEYEIYESTFVLSDFNIDYSVSSILFFLWRSFRLHLNFLQICFSSFEKLSSHFYWNDYCLFRESNICSKTFLKSVENVNWYMCTLQINQLGWNFWKQPLPDIFNWQSTVLTKTYETVFDWSWRNGKLFQLNNTFVVHSSHHVLREDFKTFHFDDVIVLEADIRKLSSFQRNVRCLLANWTEIIFQYVNESSWIDGTIFRLTRFIAE